MTDLNNYGDQRIATNTGHGVDIATQRADDLDNASLAFIAENPGIRALDIGAGHMGQSVRMLDAGADVVAMDIEDYSDKVAGKDGITFIKASVTDKPAVGKFGVILCQRMIHYLPYKQAAEAVIWMREIITPGGKLFISASGLNSELGDGYTGALVRVEERFTPLENAMAQKHAIHPPVCLYTDTELSNLVESNGWNVEIVWLSAFGNVKLIATPR